jgi:hypothetical protein
MYTRTSNIIQQAKETRKTTAEMERSILFNHILTIFYSNISVSKYSTLGARTGSKMI